MEATRLNEQISQAVGEKFDVEPGEVDGGREGVGLSISIP